MSINRIFFVLFLLSFFLRPMTVLAFETEKNREFCTKKKMIVSACCLCGLGASAAGLGYSIPQLIEAAKQAGNSCAITLKNNGQNLNNDDPVCLNSSLCLPPFQDNVRDQYNNLVWYSICNGSYSPCMGDIPACCQKYNLTAKCKEDSFPDGSIKVRDPQLVGDTHTGEMITLSFFSSVGVLVSCFCWIGVCFC
jgi:hypothetical protein